jgi:dethiobiotin synthetase
LSQLSAFRGLFVTGTDTGVGKTVVSAALLLRYRTVASLRYWKPIQTGIEEDDDTRTVEALTGRQRAAVVEERVRLPRPLSPHLAARLDGRRIELEPLVAVASTQSAGERWIVEGAGGILVPINESALMVDLIAALALPTIVVARSTLGTINHTLLTLEVLRTRGLTVAGVVMVGPRNADNREAIEGYGRTTVVGEIAPLVPLTRATLAQSAATLDPDDRLMEWWR